MPKYQIITYPHKNLRRLAKKVENPNSPETKDIIKAMIRIMKKDQGIGLAAPQIDIPLRIITICTKEGSLILINPRIARKSLRKSVEEEGCLSVPGVYGLVKRPQQIRVTGYDHHGQRLDFKASGLFARVIQHEIDHLKGVLFIDKVIQITKGKLPKNEPT